MASTCKSCGAPILWIQTPAGKWMPCNEGLVEYMRDMCGKETVVTDRGEVIRCSLTFPGPATGLAHIPHWATCPNADRHRKAAGK